MTLCSAAALTVIDVSQANRSQHPSLQALRRDIVGCFDDIACYLMPHPGLVATTSEHFRGQIAGTVPSASLTAARS